MRMMQMLREPRVLGCSVDDCKTQEQEGLDWCGVKVITLGYGDMRRKGVSCAQG